MGLKDFTFFSEGLADRGGGMSAGYTGRGSICSLVRAVNIVA